MLSKQHNGAASTIVSSDVDENRAIISNNNGKIACLLLHQQN